MFNTEKKQEKLNIEQSLDNYIIIKAKYNSPQIDEKHKLY